MKGIILAAGQGSRLLPLTADRPKCMVEYQGKPIIDYTLAAFAKCGVSDISIVKGYLSETLTRPGTKSYLNQKFDTTNMVYSLFCAAEELGSDDLVISYGDIVYKPEILSALLKADGDFCVVVDHAWRALWEQRMENPLTDAETMIINDQGYILELGKKPRTLDEIQGQYIGLIKISKNMSRRIKSFYSGLDQNILYDGQPFEKMYMTSFIQILIDNDFPVKAVPIQGGWTEIDTPSDLLVKI